MKLWVIDISGIYKLRSKNPEFRRNPEKFHPCKKMKRPKGTTHTKHTQSTIHPATQSYPYYHIQRLSVSF